jgi:type IV pilus assembly protein PilB
VAAKFDKRLKNILVKRGAINTKAAEDALALAERDTRGLTEILVEQKLISERDVIANVALEMKMPPIDVNKIEVEEAVLESLPQDLAKYYGVLPIARIGDTLTIAVSNPFDILKLDDIRIVTGCNLRPVVSTDISIQSAIKKVYDRSAQKLEEMTASLVDPELELQKEPADIEDEMSLDDKSPVVKLVNVLIMQAVKDRASDIHIEPLERRTRIRLRKDGVLHESTINPNRKYHGAIVSRVKIMASLDIAEKRVPQDGKFQTRIEGRAVDFRVSILPTLHEEKVVMRILDSTSLALDLDALGFEAQPYTDFTKALAAPYGMVIVTGPTGSGKTTTLYSALKQVMSIEDNVVTVEDPIEYQMEGVVQVPVNPKRGLTFAAALRSILRQDPDTLMIGEMRDLETVEIAVKAALTGHLVLSTLHTNDAASTITRLVDMGVEPFMVTSTVILASAQRLLRRLCGECKEPATYPRERLLDIGFTEAEIDAGLTLFRPKGCQRCNAGYRGRFAVLEALRVSDRIKRLVLEGKTDVDIKRGAINDGMVTLRRAGLMNASRGHTSIDEVLRMTADDGDRKAPGGKRADALDEDVRES